ncbi:hypothetical protein B1813_15990 [Saccharomonospora piscinae]|uniref:Uncharacterized protein n=1 Tax=Saccharomonospora piscinae TaxID=687388 RepID=A0A1V9A1T9_SACPI|nr:hypothetical protein [Saccharomonospora piscinae]OQO91000.1 hypothetical protein B1813_15990 [Saccharomonospora piscinae]
MSVFGQVWVFSAVAFVLGAFLSWLFLARPAQRRAAELQRSLTSAPSAARSGRAGGAERTRIAPAAGSREDEDDPVAPATRQVEPASSAPDSATPQEVTEHLAPAPGWLEQDSLQGRGASARPEASQVDDIDEDFSRLDALEPDYPEYGDEADADEPTQYRGAYGGLGTGSSEDDRGGRRGGSLFEPAPDADPGDSATYAYGDGPESEDTPEHGERTTLLPKRQPGRSAESFDAPRPVEPSMRPVARRGQDSGGGHGGSLFEPSDTPPPIRSQAGEGALPPGPFGPGSAMPKPGGERPSEDFTVKASVTALRYCAEGSEQYPRMVAEVWFRTPADAERVGFRPLSS